MNWGGGGGVEYGNDVFQGKLLFQFGIFAIETAD